jgi:Rrf2 family protein
MHVSAKAEYALRALLELTANHPAPVTVSGVVALQGLPHSFAEAILPALRRAGFVRVARVGRAGYSLARAPDQITVGSVLRAVDGPFVTVRGLPPEALSYTGAARGLDELWRTTTTSLAELLDGVTLQDLVAGRTADAAS